MNTLTARTLLKRAVADRVFPGLTRDDFDAFREYFEILVTWGVGTTDELETRLERRGSERRKVVCMEPVNAPGKPGG